jgi:adenosylcobinamide-phosphate synthase
MKLLSSPFSTCSLILLMEALIVAGALLIDQLFGEAENRFHPVAWMGNFIAYFWNKRPGLVSRGKPKDRGKLKEGAAGGKPSEMGKRIPLFLFGSFISIFGGALFSLPMVLPALIPTLLPALLPRFLSGSGSFPVIPVLIFILCSIILLKPVFSLRKLLEVGEEISQALGEGEIDRARQLTAYHLVSRPTEHLEEEKIAAAVIESLAENMSDSFASPLFWYALAGLPGAWAYRYINTCDAMLGYRHGAYEWGGKFPARLDDLLNFIPARITGAAILLSRPKNIGRGPTSHTSLPALSRYARVTVSPNAGYPIAAAALSLSVRLEKVNHYTVFPEGGSPTAGDIRELIKVLRRSSRLLVPFFVILSAIRSVLFYG